MMIGGGKKEQVRGKGVTKERLRAITRMLNRGWEHSKSEQSGTSVSPTQYAEPIFLLCEVCTNKGAWRPRVCGALMMSHNNTDFSHRVRICIRGQRYGQKGTGARNIPLEYWPSPAFQP